MPKIWHGEVTNVFWPLSSKSITNLDIELWGSAQIVDDCASHLNGVNIISFNGFTSLDDIPLWSIVSSELILMSSSSETKGFFYQFAALPGDVALRFSIVHDEAKALEVIAYSVKDEVDGITRIHARIVDHNVVLHLPELVAEQDHSSANNDWNNEDNEKSIESGGTKTINAVSDVKSAISQTVMGALRLRGIKRTNPDFKKIYYAMHSLVDISLRKAAAADITVELIRAKVEEIFGIIE